jgi:hypothetical protein
MLDFNDLLGPPIVKPIYVGLPRAGAAYTVHPTDQTFVDRRAYLFYSKEDTCTYVISPNYPGLSNLLQAGIYYLSESILYRGIYQDGTEFLIPLSSYGNNYERSLKKMLEDAQQGVWLVRKEDPPHGERLFNYEVTNLELNPNWSGLSFNQLLVRAFENQVIDSPTHPATAQFKQIRNVNKSV